MFISNKQYFNNYVNWGKSGNQIPSSYNFPSSTWMQWYRVSAVAALRAQSPEREACVVGEPVLRARYRSQGQRQSGPPLPAVRHLWPLKNRWWTELVTLGSTTGMWQHMWCWRTYEDGCIMYTHLWDVGGLRQMSWIMSSGAIHAARVVDGSISFLGKTLATIRCSWPSNDVIIALLFGANDLRIITVIKIRKWRFAQNILCMEVNYTYTRRSVATGSVEWRWIREWPLLSNYLSSQRYLTNWSFLNGK